MLDESEPRSCVGGAPRIVRDIFRTVVEQGRGVSVLLVTERACCAEDRGPCLWDGAWWLFSLARQRIARMRVVVAIISGFSTMAAARFEGFFLIPPLRGGWQPRRSGGVQATSTDSLPLHPHPGPPLRSPTSPQGGGYGRFANETLPAPP